MCSKGVATLVPQAGQDAALLIGRSEGGRLVWNTFVVALNPSLYCRVAAIRNQEFPDSVRWRDSATLRRYPWTAANPKGRTGYPALTTEKSMTFRVVLRSMSAIIADSMMISPPMLVTAVR